MHIALFGIPDHGLIVLARGAVGLDVDTECAVDFEFEAIDGRVSFAHPCIDRSVESLCDGDGSGNGNRNIRARSVVYVHCSVLLWSPLTLPTFYALGL
jgi:hypothetical protein